jgi:hypothetical protein
VAWTPHLAGVALKLDRKSPDPAAHHRRAPPANALRILAGCLVAALTGLLIGNLWSLQDLRKRMEALAAQPAAAPAGAEPSREKASADKGRAADDGAGRDRFLAALGALIDRGGAAPADQAALLARYERLVQAHKDLRVPDADVRAKRTVAAISVLAERTPERVEETVRRALSDKGFSDRLIKAACDHVHEQFGADLKDSR